MRLPHRQHPEVGGKAFAHPAASLRAVALSEQSADEHVKEFGDVEPCFGTDDSYDEQVRDYESASEKKHFADESAPSWIPFMQIGVPKHQPIVSQRWAGANM